MRFMVDLVSLQKKAPCQVQGAVMKPCCNAVHVRTLKCSKLTSFGEQAG